jgi:diguanylate cyclase (GGDEF)-like protein/PAS domain S-box-containing protein
MKATLRFTRQVTPRVVSASESIEGLLGYTVRQLVGGPVSWQALVHPEDQDLATQLMAPDLPLPNGSFNLRLRHADGRIRCVRSDYRLNQQELAEPELELDLTDVRSLRQHTPLPLTPQLVAMLETSDDYIYFKDCNHVFTGASKTLVKLTTDCQHWTDLIGKTDYDLLPEAYADIYYRLEKKVFVARTMARELQTFLTNDGQSGWTDNRKYPITDAQGEVIGLFGIARDITDLKRTEAALMESEHRFRTIFEQMPSISVQGYDQQRRLIYWNRASEKLYGYSQEQALGQKLEDLIIPPPMRDSVVGLVDAWVHGGPAIPAAELTLQGAGGTAVEVFSSHVMLNGAAGQPEMYCIDIDMSERNRAIRDLRASESFLRTVIDEIPDPLLLKDQYGRLLLCNQALARLYNSTTEAMIGKEPGDFGVPPEMAEAFRKNDQEIMAGGQTRVVFEDSRDALSGEIRHYRAIKKPITDAQGQPQMLVLTQDMTDVIQAQRQVTESEKRLQHVMAIIREGVWDWFLPSGKVLHNLQWYESLRYREGDVAETVQAFFDLIHPDDRDAVQKRIDEMLSGATPDYHSEHRLLRKDGKHIWVQDRGRVVERDAQGQPLRVVGSYADISYHKEHQQHLEYIAHHDTLTGLPNRALLAERLQQAMAQARRRGLLLAVAYLDLDGFKAINDSFGHLRGDQLLKWIAGHFKAMMREGDTIARLGGDEFVAVFVDLSDVRASIALVERLLEVAAQTTVLDDLTLKISASIGVSFYPQTQDIDADQLLRQADQAMYSAKLAGKNRYQLFDAEHDRKLHSRNDSLERIQQALSQQEFILYYQPMVNLRSGEMLGIEALIHWQHPQLGLLPAGVFWPEIEGQALSLVLSEWVLETSLRQVEAWQDQGLDLSVTVNISEQHLQQSDFAGRLRAKLLTHPRLKRGGLTLELPEIAALNQPDAVAAVIRECASLGIGMTQDNFGTGCSSLAHLKRMPAQLLKIDPSFVRNMLDDPEALAIVQGVLALARVFGRQVLAEGASTPAHCRQLLRIGCELAQGDCIARPMPAEALPAWVAHWRPDPDWLN